MNLFRFKPADSRQGISEIEDALARLQGWRNDSNAQESNQNTKTIKSKPKQKSERVEVCGGGTVISHNVFIN